jgi:hypothetical protein
MSSAAGRPAAPPTPSVRREVEEEWPPAAVILAALTSLIGLVPALIVLVVGLPWFLLLLAGVFRLPFSEGADPAEVLMQAVLLQGSLLAVGLPVVMLCGVVGLLKRRDRTLLIVSYLPATALASWSVYDQLVRGGTSGWIALVLLAPASAPLVALLPSVGRWLPGRPFRPA